MLTITIIVFSILSSALTVLNLARLIDDFSTIRLLLFAGTLGTSVMLLLVLNARFRPRR